MPIIAPYKSQSVVDIPNPLFPVFIKLEQLRLLLVGGGNVATEKLQAVLNNAPNTKVIVVAKAFNADFLRLTEGRENVEIVQKAYDCADLDNCDLVLAAVGDVVLAEQISADAKAKGLLINVSDKPSLCDFYLGSIAGKGSIKIAISTNGKSPTMAKRLKEIINSSLPDELEESVTQLQKIRNNLGGDFHDKVQKLNELTSVLTMRPGNTVVQKPFYLRAYFWKRTFIYGAAALLLMFFGYWLFTFLLPSGWINPVVHAVQSNLNEAFWWMFLAGFVAQLIDGAMGMGYGVLSTTFLLSTNLPIPIAGISSSVHLASMFSVGTAGISHYKYKHVNKRLWKALVIPGVIGTVLGALFIGIFGSQFGNILRVIIAVYTAYLGFKILNRAISKQRKRHLRKMTNVRPVAFVGGFLDAFGGGWGPLVTSTLISGGRDPLYTIGSSSFTKFFTSIASTATFIIVFHQMHFQVVAGLIIGGVLAAPFAAKLAGKLPLKAMFICVGLLVILCSMRVLWGFV